MPASIGRRELIAAIGGAAAVAAGDRSVPIVLTQTSNPVAVGFVMSLAQLITPTVLTVAGLW